MGEPGERPAGAWTPWALLPCAGLWLLATALKETPRFWRNEGGYPPELRAFLLDFYYPATGLLAAVALGALVRALTAGIRPGRVALVGWLATVLVLGAGAALLVANNLTNLLEGRPLHQH
jgi:hypothetical protein